MTTAREQAREAVHDLRVAASHGQTTATPETMADAASDVWEPLLRNLAEAVHQLGLGTNSRNAHVLLALVRAQKALG